MLLVFHVLTPHESVTCIQVDAVPNFGRNQSRGRTYHYGRNKSSEL